MKNSYLTCANFEKTRHEMLARLSFPAAKQVFQGDNYLERFHFEIALATAGADKYIQSKIIGQPAPIGNGVFMQQLSAEKLLGRQRYEKIRNLNG